MENIVFFGIVLAAASLTASLFETALGNPVPTSTMSDSAVDGTTLGSTVAASSVFDMTGCTNDHQMIKKGVNELVKMAKKVFSDESNVSLEGSLSLCGNTEGSTFRVNFCREHDISNSSERILAEANCYLDKWMFECWNSSTSSNGMTAYNLLTSCPSIPVSSPLGDNCNGYFETEAENSCEDVFEGSNFQAMLLSYDRQLQLFTNYRNSNV